MSMKFIFSLLFIFFFSLPALALEEEGEDITIFNLELEKLLNFGSGILALILCLLTQAAYRQTNNKRLQYVCIAFLLFAVKGFLISHELFFDEWAWVDPIASVFDFAILLIFFYGIIKK